MLDVCESAEWEKVEIQRREKRVRWENWADLYFVPSVPSLSAHSSICSVEPSPKNYANANATEPDADTNTLIPDRKFLIYIIIACVLWDSA